MGFFGCYYLVRFFFKGISNFVWPVMVCFTKLKICWAVRAPFQRAGIHHAVESDERDGASYLALC